MMHRTLKEWLDSRPTMAQLREESQRIGQQEDWLAFFGLESLDDEAILDDDDEDDEDLEADLEDADEELDYWEARAAAGSRAASRATARFLGLLEDY